MRVLTCAVQPCPGRQACGSIVTTHAEIVPGLGITTGTVFASILGYKMGCLRMVHAVHSAHAQIVDAGTAGLHAADNAWILRLDEPLRGSATGPLAGLRFAVKDNMDVAGRPTTAACPAFAYQAAAHAKVVQRLLDAGATRVGKTNMGQFACDLNGTCSPYGPVPNSNPWPCTARATSPHSAAGVPMSM